MKRELLANLHARIDAQIMRGLSTAATTTNAVASGDDGVFDIAKLKAAIRRIDPLPDDVIAVTQYCPPEKSYQFADEKGSVTVVAPAMLHRLEKAVLRPIEQAPIYMGGPPSVLGIPIIYADEPDDAAKAVRKRIMRSLDAAAEVQAWWDSWK